MELHFLYSAMCYRSILLLFKDEVFSFEIIPHYLHLALAKEGSVATRICFIKHGVCQLKKVLSVASVNQDGRKVTY